MRSKASTPATTQTPTISRYKPAFCPGDLNFDSLRFGEAPGGEWRCRPALLGHHRDRNCRQFCELHNCTNPLGDATRRPTPDAELPALSAGVVGMVGVKAENASQPWLERSWVVRGGRALAHGS